MTQKFRFLYVLLERGFLSSRVGLGRRSFRPCPPRRDSGHVAWTPSRPTASSGQTSPVARERSCPEEYTKRDKISRRSSLYRYCLSKVSVFSNCPTAVPIDVLSIQLYFLHAPSHSSFHVRNLSVYLYISCALHT